MYDEHDTYTAHSLSGLTDYTPDSRMTASGFPAASDDYSDTPLNLHTLLVRHPAATFFVRAGSSEFNAVGIRRGDLMIVDRSIAPVAGSMVVAIVAGEMQIRRIVSRDGQLQWVRNLHETSPNSDAGIAVWGVIVHVIHSFIPTTLPTLR